MANSVVVSEDYTIGYLVPVQNRDFVADRYLTKVISEKGIANIDYLSFNPPHSHYIYHNETAISAKRGESFTLNLMASPDKKDGMQWCQAIILVDWNQDYDFGIK